MVTQSSGSEITGSPHHEVVLQAENLRLRYPNGALGILDISYRVSRGQLVAFLGANGAGKTSSVRAASGFLKTERTKVIAGKVLLHGKDVTNNEPHHQAKSGLFFISERNNVFGNLTVAENLIALGRPPARSERTNLLDRVFSLFPVLAQRQRDQAGALSGGQRQMLAIARGIMASPSVLVIDELTLGLHHSLQKPLFDAVRAIAESGVGVIVVDESAGFTLEAADYCYVVAAGRIFDEGPPSKFKDNKALVAGYVDA